MGLLLDVISVLWGNLCLGLLGNLFGIPLRRALSGISSFRGGLSLSAFAALSLQGQQTFSPFQSLFSLDSFTSFFSDVSHLSHELDWELEGVDFCPHKP